MAGFEYYSHSDINLRVVENGYIISHHGGDEWVYTTLKAALKAIEEALKYKKDKD